MVGLYWSGKLGEDEGMLYIDGEALNASRLRGRRLESKITIHFGACGAGQVPSSSVLTYSKVSEA